jgi:hypothetical protein
VIFDLSSFFGVVLRLILKNRGVTETVTHLDEELDVLQYVARGCEIAGWADDLARSFSEMGGCLRMELSRITQADKEEA